MTASLKSSPYIKKLCLALMILVLIMGAAAARFYRLADHGLWDSDAVTYSSIAKRWYFDHNFVNPFAKPAYHALSWAAIKIWGYYDFTLLYLNSFLDIINILLIILIGRKIGIRWSLVLSAAVVYSFLPYILKEATRGLPHLTSSAFFLTAFYLFLVYLNSVKRKSWLIFCVGFVSIFAGNIHPTLLCGAVFYFVILGLDSFKRLPCGILRFERFKVLLVYGLGCVCVYLSLGVILATKKIPFPQSIPQMFKILFKHRNLGIQGHQGNIFSQIRYTLESAPDILTPTVVILFSVIVAAFMSLAFFNLIKRRKDFKNILKEIRSDSKFMNVCLLWGVVGSFLIINFLTARAWEARLMIPAVPLIILGILSLADHLSFKFPRLRMGFLVGIMAGAVSVYNLSHNKVLIAKAPTVYREMANVLSDKIDSHNRLLISPSVLYQLCLEAVYFYGDYVYRVALPWKPELSVLEDYNIRYVVVAKDLNVAYPANHDAAYALHLEYAFMYEGLKEMGAKLLFESHKVVIFEVPVGQGLSIPYEPPWGFPFYQLDHIIQPVDIKR